jgi:hypothetical protein
VQQGPSTRRVASGDFRWNRPLNCRPAYRHDLRAADRCFFKALLTAASNDAGRSHVDCPPTQGGVPHLALGGRISRIDVNHLNPSVLRSRAEQLLQGAVAQRRQLAAALGIASL